VYKGVHLCLHAIEDVQLGKKEELQI